VIFAQSQNPRGRSPYRELQVKAKSIVFRKVLYRTVLGALEQNAALVIAPPLK
jgi:hypothetical protein